MPVLSWISIGGKTIRGLSTWVDPLTGFLLDTNVLSEFKRRVSPDRNVTRWLQVTHPDLLWVSVLSFGEIRKGIERLAPGQRRNQLQDWLDHDLDQWFYERVLPITRPIAERWGSLSARALDRGRPLSNIDGLIAATAIQYDLRLATRNVSEFSDLELPLVNPWDPPFY